MTSIACHYQRKRSRPIWLPVSHMSSVRTTRETGTTTFEDEIYGDITVDNAELDDMILIKSDGYPTYNFANVVDDHLMGITHVVRGNEYLSSSPKYNRLYEAFGWEVPVYVHCPLITNEEHQKLSKRSGHSSYEDLFRPGIFDRSQSSTLWHFWAGAR